MSIFSDWKYNKNGLFSKLLLTTYRFGHSVHYNVKIPLIRQLLWLLYKVLDFFFVKLLYQAEFPAKAHIGEGIKLPHGGNGIVIHPRSKIGANATIFHQVTIGANELKVKHVPPELGDNVYIGCGAKLIGNIKIGNNVVIGANAVVVSDIPDNTVAAGVPAKVIKESNYHS